ncbi:MAG: FtsQ-type POTRA domain-containing protein [Verrucomicrobiae bacterium]|nr:FtsQ-type POTRA domain-containing protein [Verrucomicrobiae bacterium]NNJ43946.1 FtsQ-type POTRA domain-containing protein [Akkermansiaceae bacterium]
MASLKQRRKTTRSPRTVSRGGDLQKLHITVHSPRIVMFQVLSGLVKGVKYAVLLAMVGLIGVGGYKGVQHLFIGNEKYRLQEIDLQTNGQLSHTRVVDIASIDLNASIFAVDTGSVRESLEELPEVVDCQVERRLPGTLRIRLTERVPVVWIECAELGFPGRSNGGILADKEGITFPCEGALWDSARDLPVIVVTVTPSDAFQHGSPMKHLEVMRALHLVQAFDAGDVRAEWLPERVVLINDYSMEAICNDGSRATFGMYDHDRQLTDFLTIREHTHKTQREVKHVNLIPKKNIPVKFAGDPVLVRPQRQPVAVNPRER